MMAATLAMSGAELPVTRVVIYKNGVAYYERAGSVPAGETARLEFKAGEMDDVLKSLTVEDRSGGAIAQVRYELDEPLEKKLADAGVQLAPNQPLAVLLDQWRGARIELTFAGAALRGSILGGRLASLGDQGQRQELTLLLDSGEIRLVTLENASGLRLQDSRLQQQLQAALLAYAQSRTQEKRSVFIDAAGQGARSLAARYVVPAPVWKSSYRLSLPDTGEAMLEGWAIVENNTGEDWSKVDLTVVSGKPVSFISRLYEPRYVRRQTASLPEEEAAAPLLHEGAVRQEMAAMEADEAGELRAKAGRPMAAGLMATRSAAPAAPPPPAMISSVAPAAAAREAGELFEYRFAQPVSARRGESLLLPFVQQKIAARRLLVYSDRSSPHPRAAAELTNNTGKTLDGGPITVAQSGAYAGEALMETFKAGDKRLISYSVDLGTRVTTKLDSGAAVTRQITARRGVITTRSAVEVKTTYTVNNVDARAKTLVVEHPINASMKLISPAASETTADNYRFNVSLPASGAQTLTVVEERELQQTTQVSSLTPEALGVFVQNKSLSPAARKQLEDIAARKRELASTDSEIRRAQNQVAEIARDQERIRQNLSSLRQVAGQEQRVQAYAAEIAKGDAAAAQLRDRQAELEKRKASLEAQIQTLIEGLEF
jgi:hypothetical protein